MKKVLKLEIMMYFYIIIGFAEGNLAAAKLFQHAVVYDISILYNSSIDLTADENAF